MEFNQVEECVFEVKISRCMGISSYTDAGIILFNDTFYVRVKNIYCDLDRMTIAFTTDQNISDNSERITDTKHTINWMKADYKVHWKVNEVTLKRNTTKEALKDIQANDNIIFHDTVVDYIEKV